MRRTTPKAIAVIAAAVTLAMSAATPVRAGTTSHIENNGVTAASRDGIDHDPGCQVAIAGNFQLNGYASGAWPVGTQWPDCGANTNGVSLYDHSTETLDLNTGTLSSASGFFTASWNVDAVTPTAGQTTGNPLTAPFAGSPDLPNNTFVGGGFYALFQNKDRQNDEADLSHSPGPNPVPLTGCTNAATGAVIKDQNRHWGDGYHFYANLDFQWVGPSAAVPGPHWKWTAYIGHYDPTLNSFAFTELGSNDNGTWVDADAQFNNGTDWTVAGLGTANPSLTFKGVTEITNLACAPAGSPAPFKRAYGVANGNLIGAHPYSNPNMGGYGVRDLDTTCGTTWAGDCIRNVKFLTTANYTVPLPVSIPGNAFCPWSGGLACFGEISQVGGFVASVDGSSGTSTAGQFSTNTVGYASSGGLIGGVDTLGDGPTCPTPTFGGLLPPNPVKALNQSCQIDDDNVSRGSILLEMWETNYGFIF